MDISCDEEQAVQVQFLAYANNSTWEDSPENYTISDYNTTFEDWDTQFTSLTVSDNGSYDFYAYLINEHGDMIKEIVWPDTIMIGRDD